MVAGLVREEAQAREAEAFAWSVGSRFAGLLSRQCDEAIGLLDVHSGWGRLVEDLVTLCGGVFRPRREPQVA